MVKAFIEQIEMGHGVIKLPFGIVLKETPDILDIGTKPSFWVLDLLTGARQVGQFPIKRPHNFQEREWIDVTIVDDKIKEVKKLGTTLGGKDE